MIEAESGTRTAAVIVAHPDDETLWAGGMILSRPSWNWFILTLCRASDRDRAPRFFRAVKVLGADGNMGDLNDGPEQTPLDGDALQETILHLLPRHQFDLILSHSPAGEYTRHGRHEEVGKAIISLWHSGSLSAAELWTFAYEDGGRQYLPRPIRNAHIYEVLPEHIWQKKYNLITTIYGFEENGFEARTTPRAEAFWQFKDSAIAKQWLEDKVFQHESSIAV